MLAATQTSDFVSRRTRTHNLNMSPSCRSMALQHTPPRLLTDPNSASPLFDSPMLTPSPLRKRVALPHTFEQDDPDDIFLQSPFRSSPQVHRLYPLRLSKPQPISIDDDDGGIFLTSSTTVSSPFPVASTSQPLRTPVKRELSRRVLSSNPTNAPSSFKMPGGSINAHVGVGTKRKSHTNGFSTPTSQHATTPLSISTSKTSDPASGLNFHRLAPLPAPRFVARTPQTHAETEAFVKRQAETMKRLKLRDVDHSGDEWNEDDDSGIEVGDEGDDKGDVLFFDKLRNPPLAKATSTSPKKPLNVGVVKRGNGKEEVAEAVSPDGHVIKRRARSRPVSTELLQSINRTPSPPASRVSAAGARTFQAPIAFPSVSKSYSRDPSSSSAETGSPKSRRNRITGSNGPQPIFNSSSSDSVTQRAPMSRITSSSSATLFFGPSIPPKCTITPVSPVPTSPIPGRLRPRTSATAFGSTKQLHSALRLRASRPRTSARHSYAGPGSADPVPLPWTLRSSARDTFSPISSPVSLYRAGDDSDEDEMVFDSSAPQESSFVFSLTEGTPSPRSKKETLPTKFKIRDSGVVLTDDEDCHNADIFSSMPRASTSVSSIYSDANDDLLTPVFGPGAASGWPVAAVAEGWDDCDRSIKRLGDGGVDVDAFILRTLMAGGKGIAAEENKKPPGTPMKKMKTSHIAGNRPWQSAVAAKVGFNFGNFDLPGKGKNAPRKSLPNALSVLGPKRGRVGSNDSDTEEEQEDSPSSRKDSKYEGLGIGRPPAFGPSGAVSRTRWLMRRSSSGAFSSSSDVSMGTPTGRKDWNLPPPRLPVQLSPAKGGKHASRSRSTMTLRTPPNATSVERPSGSPLSRREHMSAEFERPGRFEKDFVEIEEVGSGEFGKVMKVRHKDGPVNEVFAVKKSKEFEGARHRLRLREEVDILQHLAHAASAGTNNSRGHHPNVLTYIDSWEQNEVLYIRTELCQLGNFARFLWEYGKAFPRLDEARVWKIFVDLSDGLRFIHEAGVIHLDFKPANIFVTGEGRFKIGDFGMASLWPRTNVTDPLRVSIGGFEREGDKVYLAREVLQGQYGKAADIFSFGITMLETATNIVVPDQGDTWHRLRQEDFGAVDLDGSPELLQLVKSMMRTDPSLRVDIQTVCDHPVISRARTVMQLIHAEAQKNRTSVFAASPLAAVGSTFLEDILGRRAATVACDVIPMDESP